MKRIKVKYILIIGIMVFGIISFVAGFVFGNKSADKTAALLKKVGIQGVEECITSIYDSHRGVHNDGVLVITYEDLEPPENILQIEGWSTFSKDMAVSYLIYGGIADGNYYGAYIERIPEVQNGYIYFLDKKNPQVVYSEKDVTELYSRHSSNFVIAVWDIDNSILYIAEYDS